MASDSVYHKILGVCSDSSIKEIKRAYHEKARKYHPDLKKNRDAPESHLRMIQLNEAYKRIVKAMRSSDGSNSVLPESDPLSEPAERRRSTRRREPNGRRGSTGYSGFMGHHGSTGHHESTGRRESASFYDPAAGDEVQRDKNHDPRGIIPHKDPAYTYYKRGYKIFTRIHPGIWYWAWDRTSPTAMAAKVQEVIDLLPLAYYYFNVVVEEYPKSHWFLDSKYKIRKLERLAPIYKKILRSYRYRCEKKAGADSPQ
jgi:hypothetical protein